MKPETKEMVETYGITPAGFLTSFEVRKLGLLPEGDDLAELHVLAEGGVIQRRHGILGTIVSQWVVTTKEEPGFVILEKYDESGTEVAKRWESVHWTEVADLIESEAN